MSSNLREKQDLYIIFKNQSTIKNSQLVIQSNFFQEIKDLVRGNIPEQDLEVLYGVMFPSYFIKIPALDQDVLDRQRFVANNTDRFSFTS